MAGKLGQTLEGIRILFRLAAEWRVYWLAFAGASVYWASDVACLWASLKPFGGTPSLPAIVLAHAVGYDSPAGRCRSPTRAASKY